MSKFHTIRPFSRFRLPGFLAGLAATVLLVGILAAAPSTLPQPGTTTVVATANPGELQATWPAVPGARFYTVGWVNQEEMGQMLKAGRDWLDAFHYATIPAEYTSHTISGLRLGGIYQVIIGASTARMDGESVWSIWSDATATQDAEPCSLGAEPPAGSGPPNGNIGLGKRSNPFPYGKQFPAGVFDIQIVSSDLDAWPELAAQLRAKGDQDITHRAPQPGHRYLQWQLEIRHRGAFEEKEVSRPESVHYGDYALYGKGAGKYKHGQNYCVASESNHNGRLYPEEIAELSLCFEVPEHEIGDDLIMRYSDSQILSGGDFTVWFDPLP